MGVIGEVMDVSMGMTMKVVGTLVGIIPMGIFQASLICAFAQNKQNKLICAFSLD